MSTTYNSNVMAEFRDHVVISSWTGSVTPRDTSGGTSGTLARFAIPKGTQVGDAIAFEHPNPIKVSIQRFVGQDIPRLTFRLVDQDNNAVTDTQGEPFSCIAVLSYDLPQ